MEELTKNIASLSWWLGVVLVGVVLNVVSAYLKAPLDSLFSAVSSRWRARSAEARARRDASLSQLKGNPPAQALLIAHEMRHRHRQLMYLLMAIFCLLFYTLIRVRVGSAAALESDQILYLGTRALYWFSLITIFLSMHAHFLAVAALNLLNEATKDGKTG